MVFLQMSPNNLKLTLANKSKILSTTQLVLIPQINMRPAFSIVLRLLTTHSLLKKISNNAIQTISTVSILTNPKEITLFNNSTYQSLILLMLILIFSSRILSRMKFLLAMVITIPIKLAMVTSMMVHLNLGNLKISMEITSLSR